MTDSAIPENLTAGGDTTRKRVRVEDASETPHNPTASMRNRQYFDWISGGVSVKIS